MEVYYDAVSTEHPEYIECDRYDELDHGLRLLKRGQDEDLYTIGYMPFNMIVYILPDEEDMQ